MKKLSALQVALASAATLHFAAALACPSLAEIDGASAPGLASTVPAASAAPAAQATSARHAWPVPGFDRMLADSRSATPAAAPGARPDVLYPFFQAQLWSEPLDQRFAASSRPERKEI